MKTQHIFVTVLVLSVCQWSVFADDVKGEFIFFPMIYSFCWVISSFSSHYCTGCSNVCSVFFRCKTSFFRRNDFFVFFLFRKGFLLLFLHAEKVHWWFMQNESIWFLCVLYRLCRHRHKHPTKRRETKTTHSIIVATAIRHRHCRQLMTYVH